MTRFEEVIAGKYGNYLLPFYWQTGTHTDEIPAQIEQIYSRGIRAFTVESRVHKGFCKETWWRDMDIILAEAEKRGMKVWILDDYQYPTGIANWIIRDKYPELRPWRMIERHVDVRGPITDGSLIRLPDDEDNELVAVYAYRRSGKDEELCGEPIRIDFDKNSKFVYFDLPEGFWRVFFYTKSSNKGGDPGLKYYCDLINAESVSKLIEAVYEPHYEHYAKYFGSVIEGFFSDEPMLANDIAEPWTENRGMYRRTLGSVGLSMPWTDELLDEMTKTFGGDPMPYLSALWYQLDGENDGGLSHLTAKVRFAYMDAVTKLWSRNFQKQVGDWCHAHGVMHIGHIIEDMNAHARLGCSAGHYFRALENQDMSGMDIVMQQVMPQFEEELHTTTAFGNVADPTFFRYILPKLTSSLAHLTPAMQGRAMCETFGAYGWAEDAPMMKWLADFLLSNGINRFVPHAFAPVYPLMDAPPYFGVHGLDPQFDAFGKICVYMNKVAHLLENADHIADAAVFYHGEGEWMSRDDAMLSQVPAKYLAEAQIDYDIVCGDMIKNAMVENGRLCIAGEKFKVLVIPTATHLPEDYIKAFERLAADGLPVIFAGGLPNGCEGRFETAAPEEIPAILRSRGLCEIGIEKKYPLLHIGHFIRPEEEYYMITNRSVDETYDSVLTLPTSGKSVICDILNETYETAEVKDGKLAVHLNPSESRIVIFGNAAANITGLKAGNKAKAENLLNSKWKIELAYCEDMAKYELLSEASDLINITSPQCRPEFSGRMRYTCRADLGSDPQVLDLGKVESVAVLKINGKDCGMKICPPYTFDISEAANPGENEIEITVSNTLVQYEPDTFSRVMTIKPSGLLGPVKY